MENILLMIKIYDISDNSVKEINEIIEILNKNNNKVYVQSVLKNIEKMNLLLNKFKNILYFIDKEINYKIDYCVTYGGDGVILWTHKYFMKEKILPKFFTINSGTLGFLCNFDWNENNSKIQLSNILNKKINIGKWLRLKSIFNKKVNYFLNECIIERSDIQAVKIDIFIDNKIFIENLICDGILISTGIGSTAYNSSIGGSFVYPENEQIILNAISPFGINFKPLILNKKHKLKIKLNPKNFNKSRIIFDGNTKFDFTNNDEVLIEFDNSYYEFIKNNLKEDLWIENTKKLYKSIFN